MDLAAVQTMRVARTRADLALAPGEQFMAGATWLYSEAQPGLTGLVDLSGLGWDRVTPEADGSLTVGAMVTVADLARWGDGSGLAAAPLFRQCAESLLASFKVQSAATVGGNVARSYAAGAMIALGATLDASASVWLADGDCADVPVSAIPAGNGVSTLAPGDAIRSLSFPAHALAALTAHRRIALAEHGRSGALLAGRRDQDGSCVLVITAATLTPVVLRWPTVPTPDAVVAAALAAPGYYSDALGSADWRRSVAATLLAEVAEELA
ncbi:FAD binding domain-containing protein [Demequina sp. NBRC 110057]|uniref:FAD binding domain-containing protein n=1 Tax=Demequina sp. NBRC 110057 TaxID=1570346 RepID=UPI0009FFE03D|nr:FAD binding domain-containing protein [Demequina sp. NBRC 110057]